MLSYPRVEGNKKNKSFASTAVSTQAATSTSPMQKPAGKKKPKKKGKSDGNIPFDRWDTNQDNYLSLAEYSTGLAGRPDLEARFKRFDKNADGKVTRQEFVGKSR